MIRVCFPRIGGRIFSFNVSTTYSVIRGIAATSSPWAKKMPDRPKLPNEEEFTEAFLRGTGPGGQKINKTSCAVQLKHLPTGLVLKVQATRSRTQNRKIAREMLAEKLEVLEKGKESRFEVVRESKRKKKSSAMKKSKRKYRALDEAKAAENAMAGNESDDGAVDGKESGKAGP